MADLFPRIHGKDFDASAPRSKPPRFTAGELIRLAAFEAGIVAIGCGDLLDGKGLSDADLERMRKAVETLMNVYREVNP